MANKHTHCIKALLKFGKKDDLTSLLKEGQIYMSTPNYFNSLEKKLRGNDFEGCSRIRNFKNPKFVTSRGEIQFDNFNLKLIYHYNRIPYNIYSLYAITSFRMRSLKDFYIDSRMQKFGSQCVIIIDLGAFLKAIFNNLRQLQIYELRRDFISYFEKKTSVIRD